MAVQDDIAVFEEHGIRRVYDEDAEAWYFSVIDIICVLTEQPDTDGARNYWSVLKSRLKKEGCQLLTNCKRLKLTAKDGKKRLTDVADAGTILRLVQSIPSPKAEPIKLWLAQVGCERMQEMGDPEKAIARARESYRKQGRPEEWIKQREQSIRVRNNLTDYWKDHGVSGDKQYAALTGITHQEWTGMSVKEYKTLKGLKSQNLRDHMTDAEFVLTMLSEVATREIAEKRCAEGFSENAQAAKEGGGVAKNARDELEAKTGIGRILKTTFCRL